MYNYRLLTCIFILSSISRYNNGEKPTGTNKKKKKQKKSGGKMPTVYIAQK